MSLFGSLFSGVSGLAAQSRAMGMISDNVANVNTTAYKGARAEFASLVTGRLGAASYSPGGVRPITQLSIAEQGLIQASSSPTDVAISGAGFFVVDQNRDGTGNRYFTRAGSFAPDAFGDLRTSSGSYLQGWVLDDTGAIVDVNQLETVNVRLINGTALPTTLVELRANLDANTAATAGYVNGDLATFASGGGGLAPDFARSMQVIDSLGRARNLELAFLKDPAANTWNVEVYTDPAELEQPPHGANGLIASGPLTFNGDGSLANNGLVPALGGAAGDPLAITWTAASGANPSSITLDLGTAGQSGGVTQFAAQTAVLTVSQNGTTVGQLNGIAIDEDGFVIATFDNGQTRPIYQLPIATFANPDGLAPRSGNLFAQTSESGGYELQLAGVGGAGSITPSALEGANVDLAEEFTRMIVTQRAYSANARVINTTDEMLDELIRIAG